MVRTWFEDGSSHGKGQPQKQPPPQISTSKKPLAGLVIFLVGLFFFFVVLVLVMNGWVWIGFSGFGLGFCWIRIKTGLVFLGMDFLVFCRIWIRLVFVGLDFVSLSDVKIDPFITRSN